MTVVCNTALSPGARLLYVLLDDYAGMAGECWPAQETLAGRLGISLRHTKRHLAELETAGHIARHRGRNMATYRMAWEVPPVAPAQVPPAPREVPPAALAYKEFLEPENEPVAPCRCDGTGRWLYTSTLMDGRVRQTWITCGCKGLA